MVCPEHRPLEQAPKALYRVRVALPDHELLLVMVHNLPLVSVGIERVVDVRLVGVYDRALRNTGFDDWHQRVGLRVLHLHGGNLAVALQHTEHGRLGLGAPALRPIDLFAFVLVGLPAAHIGLVNLNVTFKYRRAFVERRANLVQHEPRRLLRHAEVYCGLNRRDAL